jgi:hypothetical protein
MYFADPFRIRTDRKLPAHVAVALHAAAEHEGAGGFDITHEPGACGQQRGGAANAVEQASSGFL